MFIHLLAGAALGAVVVLMVWIFSGGRPFGEVVGTSDVRSPTTASVRQTDVRERAATPAADSARLESEPPDLRAASGGHGDGLQFRKETSARSARAKARARAKRVAAAKAKARARKRQVVRVVAPPSQSDAAAQAVPVAAVPSPAPAGTPVPVAAPPKPQHKPRPPSYSAGGGEG